MLPNTIRTGFATNSDSRNVHNQAVALGAVRAFCTQVYKHMCIINAIVEVEDEQELFKMSAKYELMREGSIVPQLEHIVTSVMQSPDGVPRLEERYNNALESVMSDYTRAKEAISAGNDALKHYQQSLMMQRITDISDMDGCIIDDAEAEHFMDNVYMYCSLYDSTLHEGPLFTMLSSAIQ